MMKVLELFSGLGGIHYALEANEIDTEVLAIDINPNANKVYIQNFPSSCLMQKNILSVSAEDLNKFSPQALVMSPPCQPFTRVGLKKDLNDTRADPLKHILSLLPKLESLTYVFVENVKGFENSEARKKLVFSLETLHFEIREFLISPTQIKFPNMRTRYYLLAKRRPLKFCFSASGILMELPQEIEQFETLLYQRFPEVNVVADILETDDVTSDVYQDHLIAEDLVKKRFKVMDIVTKDSTKTCCFTKAYGHYAEGTGSVFCPHDEKVLDRICGENANASIDESTVRSLRLRYFTPREVARLMSFPDERFLFPPSLTRKQLYKLLGNSVNVKVVAVLLKLLFHEPPT